MDCDWNNEAAMRAAIREEAERVLRARVKPTFTDCQGPCDQGRKLCPCPAACERMQDEPRNARPLHWLVAELLRVPHQVITGAAVAALIVVGWLAFT